MARLKDKYLNEIVPALMKEFGFSSVMQAPKLVKVVINMGVGRAGQTGGDPKLLDGALKDLTLIAGQKPVVTKAKKAIASFKVREGLPIGCKVTLRGARMYEFLDRLINVAMPRIRDFRGVSPDQFDGRGNFAMGIKEQFIFPEIDYDKIDKVKGMNVVIVTTARTDEEARHLLRLMGMPFRN